MPWDRHCFAVKAMNDEGWFWIVSFENVHVCANSAELAALRTQASPQSLKPRMTSGMARPKGSNKIARALLSGALDIFKPCKRPGCRAVHTERAVRRLSERARTEPTDRACVQKAASIANISGNAEPVCVLVACTVAALQTARIESRGHCSRVRSGCVSC